MHIIIDCTTTQDQLAYRGVGQCSRNIIINLIKNYPKDRFTLLLFNKDSTLDKDLKDIKPKNFNIVRLGKYRVSDYKNDIWYYLNTLPKIKQLKERDSIYFCPYFLRNYPSYTMNTVLFVHDFNLPRFNIYSQQNKIFNFIRKCQYWFTMEKSTECKAIICNSNQTKKDYIKYFPNYDEKNIYLSYLGPSLIQEEKDISNLLPFDYKKEKYLLYLGGGITDNKNPINVIKGYYLFIKNLKKNEPIPYLVVPGKEFSNTGRVEEKKVKDLVKKLKIEDKVIFTGFYEDDQKYSLFKYSFAYINLSLFEGFGMTNVEALRSKIPVIVDDQELNRDVLGEYAFFLNGLNPKEVGKTILKIYRNENNFIKKIVEEGYKFSLRYDWKNTASIIHDAFESISN